jgi:hypothetical protein
MAKVHNSKQSIRSNDLKQTALIKYDPLQHNLTAPVPIRTQETAKKKPKFEKINTPLSTQHFIISHLGILIFGLVFLAGLYFLLNRDSFNKSAILDYLPITQKPTSLNLEIKNPEDELLTFNKSLVLSGTASPKSTVLVVIDGSSTSYDGVEADTNGSFQKTITLTPGLNMIEVTSFDLDGSSKSATRSVYYSQEQLQ